MLANKNNNCDTIYIVIGPLVVNNYTYTQIPGRLKFVNCNKINTK